MAELSPAALAVLTAFNKGWDPNLPAALRAAANEVDNLFCESGLDDRDGLEFAIGQLFLIARELESQ
jgi:hypothetical protein